jgi:hypothetical protein
MGEPASGRPARGYSWEPFTPGHTRSLRHGLNSPRTVEAKRAEVRAELEELLEREPQVQPRDSDAVERYVDSRAIRRLLSDWIVKQTAEGDVLSVPQYIWEAHARAAVNEARFGAELGLSPLHRARLLRELSLVGQHGGFDLARYWAEQDDEERRRGLEESRSTLPAGDDGNKEGPT